MFQRTWRRQSGRSEVLALISIAPGGPETLEWADLAEPLPGRDEVRVSVRAVGLNATDLLMMRDLYQDKVPRPFSPGGEVAGVVEVLGDGVQGLRIGDRVVAITGSGRWPQLFLGVPV